MAKDPVADLHEYEMIDVGAAGSAGRITPWARFALPNGAGTGAVQDSLTVETAATNTVLEQPWAQQYQTAFETLAKLPTAELERLFTESLDSTAYRIDAWMTSLVTKRLFESRKSGAAQGSYMGAFGWVENLRPAQANTVTLPDGTTALTTFGGYVHAPSMTHAMTAAVLRNGFLTHAGAADSPYAIDMSSAQVRQARFVLDSVRNGQQAGAVFGYQIERGLHEVQAEYLIDQIRTVAPLVANKTGNDAGSSPDLVAARNVVDGLLLRSKWKDGTLFGPNGLPNLSPGDQAILQQQLTALDRSIDAVADLLLAESVHQIIRGSTTASGAGLDSLAQGVRPPEPDVGRAPTGGISLTHRVAMLLGATSLQLTGTKWAATPRGTAEPRLNAWVGSLLGNPQTVQCQVQYTTNANTVSPPITVTLDKLQLAPLDVLALAKGITSSAATSELDRRVLHALFADSNGNDVAPADAASFKVLYAADPTWDRTTVRTFPELLDLANAIAQVLGGARQLQPQDLVLPEEASKVNSVSLKAADALANFVSPALGTLNSAAQALNSAVVSIQSIPVTVPPTLPSTDQTNALRAALRMASGYGIASAFPSFISGTQEGGVAQDLLTQGIAVLTEMNRRASQATAIAKDITNNGATLERVVNEAQAIFGRDFLLLVAFQFSTAATDADAAAVAQELAQAIAYGPTLVGSDTQAPRRWLQQAARIREPLNRWRKLRLLAEASGAAPAQLDIAQLPHVATATWVALPPATDEVRIAGRISLALHRPTSGNAPPAVGDDWYGLALDEWVETIPNASEQTGISFRYEDSGGEAAQAILVAVTPDPNAANWDFDTLVSVLNDTLDWARTRGADGDVVGNALGQMLPGNFLANNANNDTIATHITEIVAENVIK
jgi:hypothetical protein